MLLSIAKRHSRITVCFVVAALIQAQQKLGLCVSIPLAELHLLLRGSSLGQAISCMSKLQYAFSANIKQVTR